MGCVLKTSTLYKDMERIHGKDHSIDAYAMAYKLDELMSKGLITQNKFVNLSNDRQIVYKVPKFEGIDKEGAGYKKDAFLKKELEKTLADKRMDTVSVRETPRAFLVTVRPDKIMTDAEYDALKLEMPTQPKEVILFEDDYEVSEEALEEQYEKEKQYDELPRDTVRQENKKQLSKVGVQLKLFEDDLTPEQSEIYTNFDKYYPSMTYLNDEERKDFIRLLSKGAIETKCKL